MLGTMVNTAAIIIGSFLGALLKGGLKEKYKDVVMQAVPLAVIFIGASGAIKGLLDPLAEPILFIISLVWGGLLGEWLGVEARLENLGDWLQSKFSKNSASSFSQGFVSASLIFCVGSMAILGSIESGILGVHNTLFAKSVLDGVISVILASTMGIGVVLSAVSVFLYQGSLTVTSSLIAPYLTENMIREISIVGGIMISCLGLNMLEIKKIRVGSLLPAVIFPVLYYLPPVHNFFIKIFLLLGI